MRLLECALFLAVTLHAAAAPAIDATGPNEPKEIVRRSVHANSRSEEIRRNYTWKVLTTIHDLDSAGNSKGAHTTLTEVLPIGGRPYRHLLEKDGKPLPPDEARKAQKELDDAVRERNKLSPEERNVQSEKSRGRRAKEREELSHIPEAFDFNLLAETLIEGRPAWQIHATPRADYKGPNAFIFHNMEGTLWIDKTDYQWVRVEADALSTISFGWFLARIAKGTRVSFENARINDEVWALKRVTLKASARVALLKKISAEQEQVYSGYRKFRTDSRLVETEEIK